MNASTGRHLVESGERFFGHLFALLAGLVLMFSGVGMGVTIVLLPLGIPVGLIGLALFLWGLTLTARQRPAAEVDVDAGPK
ncbi:MAG TPA: hypothetical protein VF590_13595 [Isosphaeraceae bacterium]|jgi:hypothetical protein